MSFLSRLNLKWVALSPYHLFLLAILSTSFGSIGVGNAYASSSDVQTYVQQAIPDDLGTDNRYNSPLQAGQMTLEDVLAAHPAPKKLVPAPVTQVQSAPLSPPRATGEPTLSAKSPNSSANVMLMQGMKSALDQASGETSTLTPPQLPNQITAPIIAAPQIIKPTAADLIEATPSASLSVPAAPQAPDQSQTAVELLQSPVTTLSVAPVPVQTVLPHEATQEPEVITPTAPNPPIAVNESAVVYQPGQAPQNLGRPVLTPSQQIIPSYSSSPKVVSPNNNTVPLDSLSTEQARPTSPTAADIVTQSPITSSEETLSVAQRPVPLITKSTFAPPPTPESPTAVAPILTAPAMAPAPTAAEIVTQQPITSIDRRDVPVVAQPVVLQPITAPPVVPAPVLATSSTAATAPTAADLAIQQPATSQNVSTIGSNQSAVQPVEAPQTQSKKSPKAADSSNCVPHVASWTKTCAEAGYPENYTGQIRGETRIVCPTNSLQDVWVANSCSPPTSPAIPAPLTVPNTEDQSGVSAKAATVAATVAKSTTSEQSSPANSKSEIVSTSSTPPAPVSVATPTARTSIQAIVQTAGPFDGVCGSANGLATTIQPNKGLCSSGQSSRIDGKGPWTWSCVSLKGGATASCSANKIQESQCGPATFVGTRDAPEDGLCNTGEATTVTGNGPWHWTCHNADNTNTASCEAAAIQDGKCGSANDLDSRKRPTDNLCSAGTPSLVTGNNKSWTWVCAGTNSGDSDNCSADKVIDAADGATVPEALTAPVTTAVTPPTTKQPIPDALPVKSQPMATKLCGAASELMAIQAPDKNLCASGMPSNVTGDGPWSWSCSDRDGHSAKCSTLSPLGSLSEAPPLSDDTKALSANDIISEAPAPIANPAVPVTSSVSKPVALKANASDAGQPECGASAGSTISTAPVEDFCTTGAPSSIRGSGPWEWDCTTKRGGSVTCSAYKTIDAMCGGANGTTQKQAPSKNLCAIGHATKIKGTGPWIWGCTNDAGNVSVKCSVAKTQAHVEQPSSEPQEIATTETSTNAQEDTASIIKTPKPFAPAPQPSSTPAAPITSDLKPPAEAASLPTDAQPVQPPAPQPMPVIKSIPKTSVNEATGTPAPSGFNLDADVSSIPFGHGSENVNSDAQVLVDKLASVLQANSNVRITLTAYADSAGLTAREARRLSLTRALAIRDYLSAKGIANSRIDVRALGAAPSGSQDRVDIKAD